MTASKICPKCRRVLPMGTQVCPDCEKDLQEISSINIESSVHTDKTEPGSVAKGTEVNIERSNIERLVLGDDRSPEAKTRSKVIRGAARLLAGEAQAVETDVAHVGLTLAHRRDLVEYARSGRPRSPQVQILPQGTTIRDVFKNAEESLLIVGPPGSGKETVLAQLGRALIDLANGDEREPVPIMLTLSSWPEEQGVEAQPGAEALIHWLAEELRGHYVIGTADGPAWIKGKKFALLLDDLDQLAPDERATCVASINEFLGQYYPVTTVVCSRLDEYQELPVHLRLLDAVEILPLTPEQVEEQLANAGEHLEALRTAIREHKMLGDLAQWAGNLEIMSAVYWDKPVDPLPPMDSIEACRAFLCNQYVDRKIEENRKGLSDKGYAPEQTVHWLRWLARKMKEYREVKNWFLVERMQPSWLDEPRQDSKKQSKQRQLHSIGSALAVLLLTMLPAWWVVWCTVELAVRPWARKEYGAQLRVFHGSVFALALGLAVLLIVRRDFGWRARCIVFLTSGLALGLGGGTPAWWAWGPTEGLYFGLGIGLLAGLAVVWLVFIPIGRRLARWTRVRPGEIQTVEELRWSLRQGLPGLFCGIALALIIGVLIDLAVTWGQNADPDFVESLLCSTPIAWAIGRTAGCTRPLSIALSQPACVLFGVLFGLLFGLAAIDVDEIDKVRPNQGIQGSLRNAVKFGLVSGLVVAVPFAVAGILVARQFPKREITAAVGALYGVAFGATVGSAIGLILGGYAAIQHGLLRLILCRMGRIPWDYEGFLEYATKLGFLKQRGGAFEFRYSRLQDHLANEWSEQERRKEHAIP